MTFEYKVSFSFRLGNSRYVYGEVQENLKERFIADEICAQLNTLPNCAAHVIEVRKD